MASVRRKILSDVAEEVMGKITSKITAIKENMKRGSLVTTVDSLEALDTQINKYKKNNELQKDYTRFLKIINEGFDTGQRKEKWLSLVEKDIEEALSIYLKMIDYLGDKNERIVFTKNISKEIVERIYNNRGKDLPKDIFEYRGALSPFGEGSEYFRELSQATPLKDKELKEELERIKKKDRMSRASPTSFLTLQKKKKGENRQMSQEKYKELGGGRKSRKRRRRTKKKRRRKRKRTKKKRKRRRRSRR